MKDELIHLLFIFILIAVGGLGYIIGMQDATIYYLNMETDNLPYCAKPVTMELLADLTNHNH